MSLNSILTCPGTRARPGRFGLFLLALLALWPAPRPAAAQTIDPAFPGYTYVNLGSVPGLPVRYGGLTFKAGDPNTLLVGGDANTTGGKIYAISVVRDVDDHITGFTGSAQAFCAAPFNDGGVTYGPGGVLFASQWPANKLSEIKPGSTQVDKTVDLATLGVADSHAALFFVPASHPGAGRCKMVSFAAGQWYDAVLTADGSGTYDVTSATRVASVANLPGGPEGFIYVPLGSPGFTNPALLLCEWSAGNVVAYDVDANGDPINATRRLFMQGLSGAEGGVIDPLSGDFLFSTFGGGDRIYSVHGFVAPGAPSNLRATVVTPNSIRLNWQDNSTNENGFQIERKNGPASGNGTYALIFTTGADVVTYLDTTAQASSTYTYRVRAVGNGLTSPYSNQASATTPGVTPDAPTNLTATGVTSTTNLLNWTDNSTNEQNIEVQRRTVTGTYALIATLAANTTSYSDTGLSPSTTYFYRVRAINGQGNSAYSNEASATTLRPPNAPSNLTATGISKTEIRLTWQDNSNDEAGFRIERKPGSGNFQEVRVVGAGVTSFISSGLVSSTTYVFRVRAYNSIGASGYSNEARGTTLGIPRAPSNLAGAAASTTSIRLTWTDNSGNETGFKVQKAVVSGGNTSAFASVTVTGADTQQYLVSGLAANTTYAFRVIAYNSFGDSAAAQVTASTRPPAAPTGFRAAALAGGKIQLTWTDSPDERGYRLEKKAGNGAFTLVKTLPADVTTYTDTGLTAGTTYTYRLAASNGAGSSPFVNSSPIVAR